MAVGAVLAAKKLWKTHPVAGNALMTAINAVTGMVVVSNSRQIQLAR